MATLAITIIALTLALVECTKIIVLIALVCAIGAAVLEILCAVLYFKFGAFKFYYHDILGWHTPGSSPKSFDGLSTHATCKHCGKDIMQDSQGNWFC